MIQVKKDGSRVEHALLRWIAATNANAALVDGERSWTHEELALWALEVGETLVARGVEPGDRVAVHLSHGAEAVAALYGAWCAGAIAVPINPALKAPQVAHILSDSGARVLFTDARRRAALEGYEVVVSDRTRSERPDLPRDAKSDRSRAFEMLEVPAPRERAPADGEARVAPTTDDRPRALADARGRPRIRAMGGGDEPAAILYTSGSTGRPKGILLSHANLVAGARIVSTYLEIRPDERILSVLPFGFDYGLNQLLTAVLKGATLVLQASHFPADVVRALEKHAITALAGVPPMWIHLMERTSPLPRAKLPSLRYITNSGGVFPVELVKRYRAAFPHVRIYLMYGLSEAFRSTYLPPEEIDRRPESMGKAIPETDVLVLDADGEPCAPGVCGELVHRGPTVALGYWNDPVATARVFRPDPLALDPDDAARVVCSGDVVKRDAEGFLYFVGRRDQLLKCYGHRVSPDEVEEIVHASGLVAEVAVHGRADPVAGAAIVAHVIPADPKAFVAEELVDFCRANMPAYMVPRAIEVHEALPRTPSGKVDKKALIG